jgi:hypothetical protein
MSHWYGWFDLVSWKMVQVQLATGKQRQERASGPLSDQDPRGMHLFSDSCANDGIPKKDAGPRITGDDRRVLKNSLISAKPSNCVCIRSDIRQFGRLSGRVG